MTKRSRVILSSIALVALISISLFLVATNSQEKLDLEKLEQACAELTKNDPDGKVYKPIVGRFLGSKSQIYSVSGPWPERIDLRMVLDSGSKEYDVYHTVPVEENRILADKLFSVVGEKTIIQKIDASIIYGICAYKNEHNYNMGALETLMKLEDK